MLANGWEVSGENAITNNSPDNRNISPLSEAEVQYIFVSEAHEIKKLLFLTCLVVAIVGCRKDVVDPEPLIVVLNGDTLYVHPIDNSTGIVWGDAGIDIPYLSNIPFPNGALVDYDGAAKTKAIVDKLGLGSNYAARVCDRLVAFGFDDWYLPAGGELIALKEHLVRWDEDAIGLFDVEYYWSSTENYGPFAWMDGLSHNRKRDNLRCRCVIANSGQTDPSIPV